MAAIAMATGIPYHQCMRVARAKGYSVLKTKGMSPYHILYHLGMGSDSDIIKSRKRLPHTKLRPRAIYSVKSVNRRGKNAYHAVVFFKGKVLDPSPRRQISVARLKKTTRNVAYDIKPIDWEERVARLRRAVGESMSYSPEDLEFLDSLVDVTDYDYPTYTDLIEQKPHLEKEIGQHFVGVLEGYNDEELSEAEKRLKRLIFDPTVKLQ